MPPALTVTNIRLTNIITNFTATINTLEILSDTFQTPFLNPICLTGRSILTCLQVINYENFILNHAVYSVIIECSATQKWMFRVNGTNPWVSTFNYHPPSRVKYRWRITTNYDKAYWEFHSVLAFYLSLYTAHHAFRTLHKINAFVEAQQHRYWIKNFFRSGEVSKLMKDCNVGLQDTINNLKVSGGIMFQSQLKESW
jgi:hypothetical protein